jgi:hypothetical protein
MFRQPRIVIGRQEDCDLVVTDVMVSKVHAEIVEEGGKYLLRDLASSNGTFLNGQMLSESGLSSGDRIRIGKVELVFFAGAEEETEGGSKAIPKTRKPGAAPTPAPRPDTAGGISPGAGPAPSVPSARFAVSRSRLVAAIVVLAGILVVLLALVAALLISRRMAGREGMDDGRSSAVARPEAGRDPGGTAPPVEAGAGGLAALFEEKAEYILLARCGRCHDGSRGGALLLHDGLDGRLRSALNLAALRPFIDPKSPAESPLLLKGTGKAPHGGGAAASAEEAVKIAAFLTAAAGKLEGGTSFLFPPRPPFPATAAGVPPEKEILLRRVFLDILGRPPSRAEVEAAGPRTLAEALDGLVGGDEYRRTWKEDPAGPLREVWGEEVPSPPPRGDIVSRLAALYAGRLDARLPRRKTPARMARSLVVDLRDRPPDEEETAELEEALAAADGEVLPLAAFLLGETEPPADRGAWIDRLHVRFLLRLPDAAERAAAQEILERKGGARILVLGLAGSPGYRSD